MRWPGLPRWRRSSAPPATRGSPRSGAASTIDAGDPGAVADLADEVAADLVVIGPEVPLVAGAVDAVEARGRLAFGPRGGGRPARGIEGLDEGRPRTRPACPPPATASSPTTRRSGPARQPPSTSSTRWVASTSSRPTAWPPARASSSPTDRDEAREAVRAYLSGEAFGDAGRTVVIEEGLTGPELSLLVLCDGHEAVPLAPAQDFKRIGDGDAGPNTGGMGAYSPVPLVERRRSSKRSWPRPWPLRWRPSGDWGRPTRVSSTPGSCSTPDGPKILEYNVRFGDPECQVVVPRLASDLATHLAEAAAGKLDHAAALARRGGRDGGAGLRGLPGRAPHRRRHRRPRRGRRGGGRDGVPRRDGRRRRPARRGPSPPAAGSST